MANSHPYISGAGNIAQMVTQLRKSFPGTVNSETVKKLGLAPKNESYVINALQFVGIIDEENKKTDTAAAVFANHRNEDFEAAFSGMIKSAYSDLFELHGNDAWLLTKDDLITFFRNSDQTSQAIGGRQAATFQVFAALAGYGDLPASKAAKATSNAKPNSIKAKAAPKPAFSKRSDSQAKPIANTVSGDFGLSVKIEINLPSNATAETYDNIFKSIRKNLIDG